MSVVADGKQKHICLFEKYVLCLICESTVGISGEWALLCDIDK